MVSHPMHGGRVWFTRVRALGAVLALTLLVSLSGCRAVGTSVQPASTSTHVTMDITQISAGDYSSIVGSWTEVAYSYNPYDGTGQHWVQGGTESVVVTSTKIDFGNGFTMQGSNLKDGIGDVALVYSVQDGYLSADTADRMALFNYNISFCPAGTWPANISIDNGVTVDPADEMISFWISNNEHFMVFARGGQPQPRVSSMPDELPSCPDGWTPVSWSTWTGGHTLVCSGPTIYVEITVGLKTYIDRNASTTPTGGVTATFDGGPTGTVSLGGGLVQITSGGSTKSYVANASWDNGKAGGFSVTPATNIPACPAGSFPLSLSVWSNQWLLTCGVQGSVTSFYYYNGHATLEGQAMTSQGDLLCGRDSAGDAVCYNASKVTVTANGTTATYQTSASYVPGTGQSTPTTTPSSGNSYPSFTYLTYYNPRFSFSIDYPVELTVGAALPDGSGQSWSSTRGNVTYNVSGHNVTGDPSRQVASDLAAAVPPGGSITYHDGGVTNGNAWGVVSGYDASGTRGYYTYEVTGTGSAVTMSYVWDTSADWCPQWTQHTYETLQHADLSQTY